MEGLSRRPIRSRAIPRVSRAFGACEWQIHASERCDFYHRTRVFPKEVAEWRERIVRRVLKQRSLFSTVSEGEPTESVRAKLDEGISYLREVARIAAHLHDSAIRPENSSVPMLNAHSERVLSRLGIYRELGLSLQRLDHTDRRALLMELIPPTLRKSVLSSLAAHGRKICGSVNLICDRCDLRNFCLTYRRDQIRHAEQSEQSDGPTVVDLFSGAGGLSEGFSQAGFRVLLALDNDTSALRTYWLNHPAVPDRRILCRDIQTLRRGELKKLLNRTHIDVLAGAPPCQGFSHAGFRSKLTHTGYRFGSDDRNFLFEYMVAAAIELRPRMLLMENVPGMLSARKEGSSFLEAAAHLLEKRNFQTAIWRMNASAYGVPQDRIRYFLVASATGNLPVIPTEEYQDTQRPDFDVDALPPININEAIFDLPVRGAGQGFAVSRSNSEVQSEDPRYRRYLAKFGLTNSRILYNHTVRYHNARDLELYSLLRPGEDSIHVLERHGRADLMRYRRDVFDDKYYRLRGDRPSKTVVAHLAKDGNAYVHPTQNRSISIREAARIQSFPDRYAFCGSASDQWVQVGNAVAPLLAKKIATSFLVALRRS